MKTKTSHTVFNKLHYYIGHVGEITNEQKNYKNYDILGWLKIIEKKTYHILSNMVRAY